MRTKLFVSALTLVVLALAAELALRLVDYQARRFERGVTHTNARWVGLMRGNVFEAIDDPVRRYAPRPGARASVGPSEFTINAAGTRGAELSRPKAPGEKRLLCLGDSYAFGLWCDDDETFVAQLARLANERELELDSGLTWTPVNVGVPGYHTAQELRAFEELGLALEPDVVVLFFNTNDLEHEGFYWDPRYGLYRDFLPLPVALKRFLRPSELYQLLRQRHQDVVERPPAAFSPRCPYAFVRADNQAYTADAVRSLAALCARRELPLFFVHLPLVTWSGDARRADWSALPLVAFAEDLRAELDLPGIDLLGLARNYSDNVDRFPAPPDDDFLFERYIADERVQAYFRGEDVASLDDVDFHLTGEGYGHVARLAHAEMQRVGLLP